MNKNILYGIGALVLIISSLVLLKGTTSGNATAEPIRLGYCPTMRLFAEDIALQNENIQLIHMGSSSKALNALHKGNIDVALIGRLAQDGEIDTHNMFEKRLSKGYTLISKEKRFIQKEELVGLTVHTYLSEDIAKQILPDSDIMYHKEITHAKAQLGTYPVLISWDDYDNEDLLVILSGSEKEIRFRLPTLYSINNNLKDIH
ncbi:MAG: hypothetical protein ACLFUO_06540 [Candidatus Woesearchaeota archaeon]